MNRGVSVKDIKNAGFVATGFEILNVVGSELATAAPAISIACKPRMRNAYAVMAIDCLNVISVPTPKLKVASKIPAMTIMKNKLVSGLRYPNTHLKDNALP